MIAGYTKRPGSPLRPVRLARPRRLRGRRAAVRRQRRHRLHRRRDRPAAEAPEAARAARPRRSPTPPKMPKVRKGDVVWVEPKLVCQVEFVEWTHDGHLRAPSYQGLREDKQPEEVHREEPLPNEIRKGKRVLRLSNLDKPFWPDEGITKGDLLALLPRRRAGARPAPARPAVHDEALSRRLARQVLLPEGRADAHARLDQARSDHRQHARAAAARRAGSRRRSSTTSSRCSGW